jgi:hypothetical protein
MKPARMTRVAAAIGMALLLVAPLGAQLKSPEDVKRGLTLLVQVSNDFKRQIGAKNFQRIPHENMEYMEAADALRATLKEEPADFKAKVEPKLKAAVAAYQKVTDMSAKTPDVDALMAEHAKAVTAMNAVFDLFPANLRPDPNAAPGGGRARGARAEGTPQGSGAQK